MFSHISNYIRRKMFTSREIYTKNYVSEIYMECIFSPPLLLLLLFMFKFMQRAINFSRIFIVFIECLFVVYWTFLNLSGNLNIK